MMAIGRCRTISVVPFVEGSPSLSSALWNDRNWEGTDSEYDGNDSDCHRDELGSRIINYNCKL